MASGRATPWGANHALQHRETIALSEVARAANPGWPTAPRPPPEAANGMTFHGKTWYPRQHEYLATRWPGDTEFGKASGDSLTLTIVNSQ
jgi:hypothetical protein